MRYAIALLVMLSILSTTQMLSAEPLRVPDEILLTGEVALLDPGTWEIGVPTLVFTFAGWEMFSAAMVKRTDAAVAEAVAPLLAEVEVAKRRASTWPGWRPVALGSLVAAGVLGLVVALK